jgi:glycosyltransferase involved in cell wall biosynthesis
MKNIILSIVVIGRNEAENLPFLFDSLKPIFELFTCETIYVDSASLDESFNLSKKLFDVSILLEEDKNLNASAGRFTGVLNAAGKWILFLDGDMLLDSSIIHDIYDHISRNDEKRGLVGTYIHEYGDGRFRAQRFNADRYGHSDHFGGAVLLPAIALQSVNWDPRLFSNEEIDLYTKLRSQGYHVCLVNQSFIRHKTDQFSKIDILMGNFICKNSFLGKKFFGIGQMLFARITDRKMLSLIRWFPEPFVFWFGVLLSLIMSIFGYGFFAFCVLLVSFSFVYIRKSFIHLIIYAAFLPQIFHGLFNFSRYWQPKVALIIRNEIDKGIVR